MARASGLGHVHKPGQGLARMFVRLNGSFLNEDAAGVSLRDTGLLHAAGVFTTMRADGHWSGMADWWIPAAERTARDRIGLRPAP